MKHFLKITLIIAVLSPCMHAFAKDDGTLHQSHSYVSQAPPAVAVSGPLPSPTAGVTDLKFGEFFHMPIGPRGLEPSEKLLSLAGKQVRVVGYMARQETPTSGFFILAPLPVSMGDEDESLADDLPASAVFVHLAQKPGEALPYFPGLLRLTGTLSLGSQEESDGHVSSVRLNLDPELAKAMTEAISPQVKN